MKKLITSTIALLLFAPKISFAHCPLCTAGAGALAVLAASLGISSGIVGILIGTFASVLALYLAKVVKKKYFAGQNFVIIVLVYLSTVIPIAPLVVAYAPLYITLFGEYGTLLHNTYTVHLYWFGIVVGTLVVLLTPYISSAITRIRKGKKIDYQRMITMFALVILASIATQMIFN